MSDTTQITTALHTHLRNLLTAEQAHVDFDRAVAELPAELQSVVPRGLVHSAWQIVEHIRITQRDILDFSRNQDRSYRELAWPREYWPQEAAPDDENAWSHSIQSMRADLAAFLMLVEAATAEELIAPFPWGDGQTLLREAMLIADHNAYHVGELISLRRQLRAWHA
jgi:hypothetical protein